MQTIIAKQLPETSGPQDHLSTGPQDYGTTRPEEYGTRPAALTSLPSQGRGESTGPRDQKADRPTGNGGTNGKNGLVEALIGSKIFHDYERAFTEATGLPVALRPVESWQLPHHGNRNQSPFFGLMAQKSRACAPFLHVPRKLSQ